MNNKPKIYTIFVYILIWLMPSERAVASPNGPCAGSVEVGSKVAQDIRHEEAGLNWERIEETVRSCVSTDPHAVGQTTFNHTEKLRWVCSSGYRELDPLRIELKIDGKTLEIQLVESENSDGGDLFHVYVKDSEGELVAVRTDIPAFGDPLLGCLGGSLPR